MVQRALAFYTLNFKKNVSINFYYIDHIELT